MFAGNQVVRTLWCVVTTPTVQAEAGLTANCFASEGRMSACFLTKHSGLPSGLASNEGLGLGLKTAKTSAANTSQREHTGKRQ